MKAPRIMLAASASGSGKTLITCGLLQVLVNQGKKISAFKCGPDYIDPMFHGKVMGIQSKNLDTFFADEDTVRYLFGKEAVHADISVLEGVMGYYDGIAGISTQASAFDVARVTDTPVILVVDTKGMSLSVTALIKGFLEYKSDSQIKGVILNRMSAGLYPRIKMQIESELPIKVLGYVPKIEEYVIENRHLGLVTPDEVKNLQEKLMGLADLLEESLDIDGIVSLANEAVEWNYVKPKVPKLDKPVMIGIARDEAFCFYYRDNLELMEAMGAKLIYFSPLHDGFLPEYLDGIIFYGGYPELYAKELSQNTKMLTQIRAALQNGMPYLAECGGFMYLHDSVEDMDGKEWPMIGWIQGKAFRTERLQRFGYVTLEAKEEQILGDAGLICKAHEFHYFDSTANGRSFVAQKPLVKRSWECIHGNTQGIAGFPHLYYYSNPEMIFRFLQTCQNRKKTED